MLYGESINAELSSYYVDFNLPRRFRLRYLTKDKAKFNSSKDRDLPCG